MDTVAANVSAPNRNGHSTDAIPTYVAARTASAGWFSSGLAHLQTGLLLATPLAPVVATFATVLLYIEPREPSTWRTLTGAVPAIALFPLNILCAWIILAIPLAVLRLGGAMHANSSSYSHLISRLLSIEAYRGLSVPNRNEEHEHAVRPHPVLNAELDFVWKSLETVGPKWMLGDGFISLWRLVDHLDASLNYLMTRDRVWARAQGLLMWLPNPSAPTSGIPDVRGQLTSAIDILGSDSPPESWTEARERGSVAQIQALIDSSKTDRYAGFVRARNTLLASCTLTAIALYGIFWLGIVALPADVSQPILSSALFFTTIGALVGLFQLLYGESRSATGIDDYGLSLARLVVAPQLAALAALVGVVLTSLATSTLSGSPTAPTPAPMTIPDALNQIRNPANVLVAVAFALSPGLVFSRFRQTIEQNKRDLTKSSSASIVHTKAGA
jgi:hypothetical protein